MPTDGPVIGLQPTLTLKEPPHSFDERLSREWQEAVKALCDRVAKIVAAKSAQEALQAQRERDRLANIDPMDALSPQEIEEAIQAQEEFDASVAKRAAAKAAQEALEARRERDRLANIDPMDALSPQEIEEAIKAQEEFNAAIAEKEEFDRLNTAAPGSSISESKRDSVLNRYQANIDSLAPRRYITDDAIDLAYREFSEAHRNAPGVCLVDSVPAQCLMPIHANADWQRARDVARTIPEEAGVIIFPVNDAMIGVGDELREGGNHWTTLVYDRRDPANPTFYYYDSLSQGDPTGLGERAARKIYELMEGPDRLPRNPRFVVRRAPQQTAPDCGIMLTEVSRLTAERCARDANAPIGDINYSDIRTPEAVREGLIEKFEASRAAFLNRLSQASLTPARTVQRSSPRQNTSSNIADTIKALEDQTDEAILKRPDVKPAPANRGIGRVVKQMPNGDVIIQVADKRRPDSTNPLYLVKGERLQVTGPYQVGDPIRYAADTQSRGQTKGHRLT